MSSSQQAPLDYRLCCLLPSYSKIDQSTIEDLKKKTNSSREAITDILGSMYTRAFGLRYLEQIKQKRPITLLHNKYIEWIEIVEMVEDSRKKSEPLAKSPAARNRLSKIHISEAPEATGKVLRSWQRFGVNCHPCPMRETPLDSPFYCDAEHAQEKIDSMVQALYTFSKNPTKKITGFPHMLLPLATSTAIDFPGQNFSWLELVLAYLEQVDQGKTFAKPLLQSYPFHVAVSQLSFSVPRCQQQSNLPFMRFQNYIAKMTIKAMGHFFEHEIPEELEQELTAYFLNSEKTRSDLITFISNTYKELKKDKNDILPEETYNSITKKSYSSLFLSSLMALRMKWTLFTKGTHDPSSHVITWAFQSNRQFVLGLDFFQYEKPHFSEVIEPENLIDEYFLNPKTAIAAVLQLEPLYPKQKSFNKHALSLLIGLLPIPEETYSSITEALLLWGKHPLNQVSTDQVLDYFNQKNKKALDEMKALFDSFTLRIPKQVKNKTEAFFPCIYRSAHIPSAEILNCTEAFNQLINLKENDQVDSTLYFSSLEAFITGRINNSHFAVMALYHDEYPLPLDATLALLLQVVQDYAPRHSKAPAALLQSLSFASKMAEQDIQATLDIFKKWVSQDILPADIKALRQHPLSKLPDKVSEWHTDQCVQVVTSKTYHFSPSQQLYILHELLSLQDQELYIQTTDWIKWIEFELGCSLDVETATALFTYHPNFNFEEFKETFKSPPLLISKLIQIASDPIRSQELIDDLLSGESRLELLEKYLHCHACPVFSSAKVLQRCQNYQHGWVTKEQVQTFLMSDQNCPSQEIVGKLTSLIPQNLIGRSSKFFDLVIRVNQNKLSFPYHQITSLNNQLDSKIANPIQASTYFKALLHYLNLDLSDYHFEIFYLYQSRFPMMSQEEQLNFMMTSITNFIPSPEILIEVPEAHFPQEHSRVELSRSLRFAIKPRAPWIQQTIRHFELRILKHQLSTEETLILYRNPLRPFDTLLTDEHVTYSLSIMEGLKYPFTISERLYVFYHLLAVQNNKQEVLHRIRLLKVLERVQGHQMGSKTATLLMTHEETLDYKALLTPLTQFLTIRNQIKSQYLESICVPSEISRQLESSILTMLKALKLLPRPDLSRIMHAFFQATSIYKSVDHLTLSSPKKIEEQTLIFPNCSSNNVLLPLGYPVDLSKAVLTSWEIFNGNIQVTTSLIETNTYTSYSHKFLIPLPIENYHSLEPFLIFLREVIHHIGVDRGDESFPLETIEDLKKHPKIVPLIEDLPYQEIHTVLNAVHVFLFSLRTGLRKLPLYFSSRKKTTHVENFRELFKHESFPLLASAGDIYPIKGGHAIIPKRFLHGLPLATGFYSSINEIQTIDISQVFEACQNMVKYLNGSCHSHNSPPSTYKNTIPITISENLINPIEINSTLEIKPTEISLENPAFGTKQKLPAIEVICSGNFIEESIQSTKIYLLDELKENDKIKTVLSWQLADFKQKLYGKIRMLQEFQAALEKRIVTSLFFTFPELSHEIELTVQFNQLNACILIAIYKAPACKIELTKSYALVLLRDFTKLKKIFTECLNELRFKVDPSENSRKKETFEKVGSDELHLKDSHYWLINPSKINKDDPSTRLRFSSITEISSLPLIAAQTAFLRGSQQWSDVLSLYFTPNLEEERALPLIWTAYKKSAKGGNIEYQSHLTVFWFGALSTQLTQKEYFFYQTDLFRNLHHRGLTNLKKDVYHVLSSLQDFLDRLLNRQEARWTHPHLTKYFRQIKGFIEDEYYLFHFMHTEGKNVTKSEVKICYKNIHSELDLLLSLNENFSRFLDPHAVISFPPSYNASPIDSKKEKKEEERVDDEKEKPPLRSVDPVNQAIGISSPHLQKDDLTMDIISLDSPEQKEDSGHSLSSASTLKKKTPSCLEYLEALFSSSPGKEKPDDLDTLASILMESHSESDIEDDDSQGSDEDFFY